MREKIVRCAQVCVLGAVVVLLAQPAWGVLNNGFETDYVYVTRWESTPGNYEIRAHNESDGAEMFRLAPPGDWLSITFSGTGTTDAWLYALAPVTASNDILVARLDSTGATQDSVNLSSLAGALGTYESTLSIGNIRFSSYYPNHVFVSAVSDASGSLRGMVWQLDLALDTLANTYVGPPIPSIAIDDSLRTVGIDINDNDGSIYMCGQHLNQPQDDNKGDLVKFTSLITWEVLVDGDNYSAGDPRWAAPRSPIFRGSNPTDGTPTVLVPMNLNTNGDPALEFYLDTGTHPKVGGNLECRGSPITLARGQWGQQDSLNTALWIGTIRNGIATLRPDDVGAIYQGGSDWHDCDSPPYSGDLAPKIYEVSPDPISIAEGTDYEKQLYLVQGKPAPSWSLAQGPAGATIDANGFVSGWTPTGSDIGSHTFEALATIGLNSDSEEWTVNVPAVNNGFFTDSIYVARAGQIRRHNESDATWIEDFPTDGTNSLTFSGKGTTDARLFTAQGSPAGAATDIIIHELDAEGTVVNTVNLSTLLGVGQVGPAVFLGNIRYSEFSNTLFIGANTNTAASNPAMAWEVDLELTTVLATFTGPNVPDRQVNVDINPQDGTLYMTSRHLGDPTATGLGDLVSFVTTGGSTNVYTTLIEGSIEFEATIWNQPSMPIYRGPNNPSERPTILILTNWSSDAAPVLEYYLDETVPFDPPETPPINAGNLLKRGQPTVAARGWNGQLDTFSGDVWIAELRRADWGVLRPDDTAQRWGVAITYNEYTDIDSPPYGLCNVPFADADGDGDVDQDDFAVFQVCFTGEQPLHPPIPASPFYCGCFDRESGGDATDDIDTKDFNAFQACATGPGIHFDPDNPPGACVP